MLGGVTGRSWSRDAKDRINAELLQAVLGGSTRGLDPVAYLKYKRDSYAKDVQRWWRHMLVLKGERQERYIRAVLLLQRCRRGKMGRIDARKKAEQRARQQLLNMAVSGIGGRRVVFNKSKAKGERLEMKSVVRRGEGDAKKAKAAEDDEKKKKGDWLKSKRKKNKTALDTKMEISSSKNKRRGGSRMSSGGGSSSSSTSSPKNGGAGSVSGSSSGTAKGRSRGSRSGSGR